MFKKIKEDIVKLKREVENLTNILEFLNENKKGYKIEKDWLGQTSFVRVKGGKVKRTILNGLDIKNIKSVEILDGGYIVTDINNVRCVVS